MNAANTTSQAAQIKTDTHQTACVKNEISPAYEVQIQSEEENIIVRIPRKLDTDSTAKWTLIPEQNGQL